MSAEQSRYRADAAPDYSHRFHAGNIGDVWKHCALVEVLRRVAATVAPVTYIETHAGEGRYALAPTGEWTGGIGKLYARQDEIGTPSCVTVDHQSLEDEAVTVRDRDTWEQERVKVADLQEHLLKRLAG